MEQRRLRLGDILDDYCPRERRVTNHAVVAMIDEDVKQTRCTTCDAEHPYKEARVPRRRKKEAPGTLYKEVLEGMPETERAPAPVIAFPAPNTSAAPVDPAGVEDVVAEPARHEAAADAIAEPFAAPETAAPDEPSPAAPSEDGPVHRPLIRATLPRPEGQKDARPLPEFTIRQNGGRGNAPFRGDRLKMRGGPGISGNGNRAHGGARFQTGRPAGGGGRGPGGRQGGQQGFRSGQPRHGGKKGRGSRG